MREIYRVMRKRTIERPLWVADIEAVIWSINQPCKELQNKRTPSGEAVWGQDMSLSCSTAESRSVVLEWGRSHRGWGLGVHQSQFIEQYGPGLRSWDFIWGAMGMTFSCDFQLGHMLSRIKKKTSSYKHLEMLYKMTLFCSQKLNTDLNLWSLKREFQVPGIKGVDIDREGA